MSNIHYPTMSSPSRRLFETHRDITPPAKHGFVQNGFLAGHSGFRGARHIPSETIVEEKEEEELSAKKRRASFPPIPLSRYPDVKVAPPKSRHSMAEVVARMRVREKTLLGDDLSKLREKKTEKGTGSGGKLSTNGAIPITSVDATVNSDRDLSHYTRAEWLASQSALFPNPRTRKHGTVAFSNAWGTPREPAVSALEVHGISNNSDSLTSNDGQVVDGHSNGWHHSDDDVDDSVESPEEEESVSGDESDDDEFDFDEGEEEGELLTMNFCLYTNYGAHTTVSYFCFPHLLLLLIFFLL